MEFSWKTGTHIDAGSAPSPPPSERPRPARAMASDSRMGGRIRSNSSAGVACAAEVAAVQGLRDGRRGGDAGVDALQPATGLLQPIAEVLHLPLLHLGVDHGHAAGVLPLHLPNL